jgi:uncharacterized phosphosugar-binding protein
MSAGIFLEKVQCQLFYLENQLDNIVNIADKASELMIQGGELYGTSDEVGFVNELNARSGGLMNIKPAPDPSEIKKGDVIFAATLDLDPKDQEKKLQGFRDAGAYVILIGSRDASVIGTADSFIDTGLSSGTAPMVPQNGKNICPAGGILNITALWLLTAEYAAACTRRGKMHIFWQSACLPDGKKRNTKYKGRYFHTPAEFSIPAIPPEILGRSYLDNLHRCFSGLSRSEIDKFREAGSKAAETIKWGGTVWCEAIGHHMPSQRGIPGDPEILTMVFPEQGEGGITLKNGDLYIYNGYYIYPEENLTRAREAEIDSVWITGGREIQKISPFSKEIHIDAYWRYADASLFIPNYDVKIVPASGVVMTTTLWMMTAETAANL